MYIPKCNTECNFSSIDAINISDNSQIKYIGKQSNLSLFFHYSRVTFYCYVERLSANRGHIYSKIF